MEKASFLRQQGIQLRLPPGFRFHPTDEELVVQYLKRKVFSCPLPAAIIPEIELSRYDPWDLPGGSESERYFFNMREAKYRNGNQPYWATPSGYWKATGKDKQIVGSRGNQVVGMKKILVFYRGKPPRGSRTDWIMHEYRLAGASTQPCVFPLRKNSTHNSPVQMEDWMLCRIFLKKRATKDDEEMVRSLGSEDGNNRIRFIDFMRQGNVQLAPSSNSESSCVTELELSDESGSGEDGSSSSASSSPCRREV